jgi:hypothetical protein
VNDLQPARIQVEGVKHQSRLPASLQGLFHLAHAFDHEEAFALAETRLLLQFAHPLDARVMGGGDHGNPLINANHLDKEEGNF